MDLSSWTDGMQSGHDAIDSCHREMLVCLRRIRDAVDASRHAMADRLVSELYDLCAIHAQIEDDCFVGQDHAFPHEALDDMVIKLRSAVRNKLHGPTVGTMLCGIEHALLSDISMDKNDLACVA